jgi:SNF2 family DNA or RNA helicase
VHATLRPYQQRGIGWLSFLHQVGLGAVLADDMGLGKTLQTLALLVAERGEAAAPDGPATAGGGPERPAPTLLICPMSVVGNWQREAQRFTPGLSVHVHHGSDRITGDDFPAAVADADLVITTYALALRDATVLRTVSWGRIVLDEAQNIKNSATKQAKAIRALPAAHRVALTGTPVENRLSELWSIMDFANPGILGPLKRFTERFSVPIEKLGDQDAAARLRQVTGPFVLRRLKTDSSIIADLPDKIEMNELCNLTAEQASLYRAVVDDMLARIESTEGIERKGLVLATMTKLKQVCNHPAHFLRDGSRLPGRSGKLARLEEILGEVLAEGDKALCFTQFTQFGTLLHQRLTTRFGTEVLYLHGGIPKKRRDEMVARFQADGGPSIFLLSLKAGGTGLNLTAANHVMHVDRWWNPAVEDQATDRAFRIGQRSNVQVRKFVCVGTLEERIDAMIESKKALARMTIGSGENWLTELSVAQLRDLISLSGDAVAE